MFFFKANIGRHNEVKKILKVSLCSQIFVIFSFWFNNPESKYMDIKPFALMTIYNICWIHKIEKIACQKNKQKKTEYGWKVFKFYFWFQSCWHFIDTMQLLSLRWIKSAKSVKPSHPLFSAFPLTKLEQRDRTGTLWIKSNIQTVHSCLLSVPFVEHPTDENVILEY